MTLERPVLMQAREGETAFSYTAQELRSGLVSSIFSREGVIGPEYGALRLDQRGAGANFSIDIYPGRCTIFGDDASDQGAYVCNNTAIYNLDTPAAPGTGTRRHRVIAQLRDRAHNTGLAVGTYEWQPVILPDVGAGTPDLPDSAITLGYIRMSAGMVSVQTANIDTEPDRATVGTPDRTGTFTVLNDYSVGDSTRPLRWSVNSDGWVSLGGWIRFVKPNAPLAANGTFTLTNAPLPATIRPTPAGYRDMMMATSFWPVQCSLTPAGHLVYRCYWSATLLQNSSWWSFDGIGWKL